MTPQQAFDKLQLIQSQPDFFNRFTIYLRTYDNKTFYAWLTPANDRAFRITQIVKEFSEYEIALNTENELVIEP